MNFTAYVFVEKLEKTVSCITSSLHEIVPFHVHAMT